MAFLELDALSKDFGGLAAVDRFSLRLERGALHALVGPNGCGKSTLFNLITGALAPSAGSVVFDGEDITGLAPHAVARRGIGRKFQVPAVLDELTVAQNLMVPRWAGRALPLWAGVRTHEADEVAASVGLAGRGAVAAGALSHGERQWLEIGMLLAGDARLLLLDEPTAGMTMPETSATADLVLRLVADFGASILVIEHDMGFIRQLACPVTVMASGRLLRSGSYAEIRADPAVRELYFGRHG